MEKWQQAAELLNKGHYERVGQLLQVQQEAAQRSGQLATAVFLAAASQLCLTCLQFRAERELHQLGLDEALRREHELRQQIQGVLSLLSHQGPLETQADLEAAFNLPPTQSILDGPEEANSEKQPNLLQKIQQRLGFELALESGKQEAKAGHQYPQAEQEPARQTETDKNIVSSEDDQNETPSTSQLQEQDRPTLPLSQAETELLQSAIDSLIEPGHQKTESLPAIDPEALVFESQKSSTMPIEDKIEPEVSGTSPEIALLRSVMNMMDEPATKPESSLLFPEDELLVVKAERAHKRGVEKDGFSDASPGEKAESDEVDDERLIPDKQTPEPAGPLVLPALAKGTTVRMHERGDSNAPSLVVYCLGPFQVYLNNQPIEPWPSSKGKSIFKYLVIHRQNPVAKEILMDLFWPGSDPDAARNNLNVAIYSLRQSLRNGYKDFSHVIYQNECYLLNPELQVWLDIEEFMARFQGGQRFEREGQVKEAIQEYHAAEALYQGEFLTEDRYEEWLMPLRQQLTTSYIELLERLSQYYYDNSEYTSCITVCRTILSIDSCHEDIHRRLMHCYYHQGQLHLALRQYHQCVKVLKFELDVTPTPDTKRLYERIRRHENV